LSRLLREIETAGKPFVAAINGSALGGGYEICLACHYRLAADNPKTQIGLPEVTLGLLPGAGGTQRLPRMIGLKNALPMLMEGRKVGVAKAGEIGLVDEIVAAGELMSRAKQWLLVDGAANVVKPWDKKVSGFPAAPCRARRPGSCSWERRRRCAARPPDYIRRPRQSWRVSTTGATSISTPA
jgi:3-hydroxyacyl-CoA dehydrogenase/enoyl-CoA hydratase/3-hydroxybutyryl-CoA epimerase